MILAAGMSPAWQQILEFEAVRVGQRESGRASDMVRVREGAERCPRPASTRRDGTDDLHRRRRLRTRHPQGVRARRHRGGMDRRRRADPHLHDAARPGDRTNNRTRRERRPLCVRSLRTVRPLIRRSRTACKYSILTGSLPPNAPTGFTHRLAASSNTPTLLDIRGPELLEVLPRIRSSSNQIGTNSPRPSVVNCPTINPCSSQCTTSTTAAPEWVVVTDGGRACGRPLATRRTACNRRA